MEFGPLLEIPPLARRMVKQAPRPGALVVVSAAMLSFVAVSLIACLFLALASMGRDPQSAASFSGPAWLGAVVFPVPAALLLLAEYRSIRRRDVKASAWIAGLCLWFPVAGSVGWVEGLLRLTGAMPRDRQWHSWAEFGIYAGVLVYTAVVGFGHLHWWRVLRASKIAGAATWDA